MSRNLHGYGSPHSFIETRLAQNKPIKNKDVSLLNQVMSDCKIQMQANKENQRIAALQKSALK